VVYFLTYIMPLWRNERRFETSGPHSAPSKLPQHRKLVNKCSNACLEPLGQQLHSLQFTNVRRNADKQSLPLCNPYVGGSDVKTFTSC
jgi:hypothetical protein